MKTCGLILSFLYAALMIFSILKARSKGIPAFFIAAGCVFIFLFCAFELFQKSGFIYILIVGMILISIGTFLNGARQNNIHIHHHIIRLIVETAITLICWISI